jgi:hypothetical protein
MDADAVQKLRNLQPQGRPELAKALFVAGSAPVQLALVPSDDARRMVESMLATLPGGEPSTTITHGVQWAGASIQIPPRFSAHIIVQSQDQASAESLKNALAHLPKSDSTNKSAETAVMANSMLSALFDAGEKAKIDGSRLLVDLDENQSTNVAADLNSVLRTARSRALRVRSMSNMRQIIIGGFIFADNHNHQWPTSLDELAKTPELAQAPQIFVNPRNPTLSPGYIYLPPKNVEQMNDRSRRVVLYEAYRKWDAGVAVGYADGHVEFVQDEAAFRKQLPPK